MKKYVVLLCIGLVGISYNSSAKNCENRLIVKLLENLLNNSNLILPKTTDIQERIGDCSLDDTVILSQLDIIESLVESISVSTSDELVLSQLDIIESIIEGVSVCCDANGSQLDVIESKVDNISVSTSDELILSQLDVIESKVDVVGECCASSSDVLGEVVDIGSCLDSAIDVPDDINNLTLTVIALLKTILLDLRGCNIP
jgi:hypothetical protein